MGTTAEAFQQGGGRFGYALIIEGYDAIITNADDLDAVVTAWGATTWTRAIPGLRIEGSIDQEIRPWTAEIAPPSLKFIIQGDTEQDEFGELVWQAQPNVITRMTQPFAGTHAASTLTVQNTGSFPASGPIFIGPSRVETASKTGIHQFNLNSAKIGTFAPFRTQTSQAAGTWQFPRGMPNLDPSTYGTFEPAVTPKVSDTPRIWIGRWCGLWMHRISGGVWDTKAEAELLFAGKIVDLQDSGAATVVEAEDLRCTIRDTVLLERQFTGHVKAGIRLYAGDYWLIREGTTDCNPFVVVNTGAAGANQINAGHIKTAEFLSRLNEWMASEKDAARTGERWSIGVNQVEGRGLRTVIRREGGGASNTFFIGSNINHARFLGYDNLAGTGQAYYGIATGTDGVVSVSDSEPFAVKVVQPPNSQSAVNSANAVLELEDTIGEWVENGEHLPHPFAGYNDSTNADRGFVQIDDQYVVFARHDSDSLFTEITFSGQITQLVTGGLPDAPVGRRYSESEPMQVKQIVFLGGTFADVLTKLLASIDGNGTNHPDHDIFPFGAGIPWELLGDGWERSVESLEQSSSSDALCIPITKPTRLVDAIASDIILRFAFWIFKGGVLRLVSPPTPSTLLVEHTFDESNKGATAGQRNDLRTASRVSKEYMRNVIKVEYDLKRQPPRTFNVVDSSSIAEYGITQALTIRAGNAFSVFASTGIAINELVSSLVARAAPLFGRPVRVFRRTINGTLFHACPGDTGILYDDFARDPSTGARGISEVGRLVTVLRTSIQWPNEGSEAFGEVDLMFSEEDRVGQLGAAANVDATYSSGGFTSGWDSAAKQLKLEQHGYSSASEEKDVTYFDVSGTRSVRIVEIDPDDPATGDEFADELTADSPSTDVVTLQNGFGAGGRPAFDSTKRYRVTRPVITSADISEASYEAFLADKTDGRILDFADPNVYAEDIPLDFTWDRNDGTEPMVNHVDEALKEGHSLSTGLVQDLVRASNALTQYHTAYSCPVLLPVAFGVANAAYQILCTWKIPAPYAPLPAGTRRRLTIAPFFRASGGTAYIRVTISPTPVRASTISNPQFDPPYAQLEFSTTSSTYLQVTSQQVTPPLAHSGEYYVLVEGKNAGGSCSFHGLTRFQLGPLEPIA